MSFRPHLRSSIAFTSLALIAAACSVPLVDDSAAPDDVGGQGGGHEGGHDPTGGSGGDGGSDGPWQIELSQAGGTVTDIAVVGQRAYVATSPRLVVWDIAKRSAPRVVGRTEPFAGNVRAVAVAGTHAYVAEVSDIDGRIHIVDVQDAESLNVLSTANYSDSDYRIPTDLAVDADRLYIADHEVGLVALDIADPTAPVVVATEPDLVGASHLQVVGSRVYVTMAGSIGAAVATVDRHDDTILGIAGVPTSIDFEFMPGALMVAVGQFGTFVFDMHDPWAPLQLWHDPMLAGRSVSSNGTRALVPGDDGLHVLGLSAPHAIVDAGPNALPVERTSADAAAGPDQLFMTDHGRAVLVDVEASSITGSAERAACADCAGVASMGDQLLVADFYTGIRVLNAADLSAVGRFQLPGLTNGAEDVAVTEEHIAVLADWSTGVYLVDLSEPTSPEQLAYIDTPGFPSSVVVRGSWAFIGESTGEGAVRAIDISTPEHPAEVAAVAANKVRDLALTGDMVVVADEGSLGAGGVRVLDATEPAQLNEVAHYTPCESAVGVAAEGTLVVAACTDGFHFIDVTDPTAPGQLAVYGTSGSAVAIEGQRAYLGHATGVDIVDVADPGQPALLEQRVTANDVRAIALTGERRIAITTGTSGVYHFEVE